jgi:glycyl-tRNA synthetase
MSKLEDIVSLCKRRGFIFHGSEIYDGLSGTWDWGPLGVALKRKVMGAWWRYWVEDREDMYGVDAAIIMNPRTWVASGHVATFADPLVEDLVTKKRYRADHLVKDAGFDAAGLDNAGLTALIREKAIKSPDGNAVSEVRSFNMMFATHVGAAEDEASVAYLRPETAQGIFTNYRNIIDTVYPDVPFGIAQQGKAFRNEISPRDFVFRSREFEQMEIEYFVAPEAWEENFERLLADTHRFLEQMGLPEERIHELEVPENDRAHYSKRTVDIEFDYPIGREELLGIAYRTDFDLGNIQRESGKSMDYRPKDGSAAYVPHVIEPSFGVERLVMAIMVSAYAEEEVNDGKRTVLKLPEHLAPYRFCVSPLLKNKPELVKVAQEIYTDLRAKYGNVTWDDSGNIGKRYRKQDEIGTPKCIVVDFTTLEDGTVTVRDRDTMEQIRVKKEEL